MPCFFVVVYNASYQYGSPIWQALLYMCN